uniref:Uncharacterized protein n=1 Tax=Oryza brachyantha TaxID=4533 RepID=J3LA22_ORYBR
MAIESNSKDGKIISCFSYTKKLFKGAFLSQVSMETAYIIGTCLPDIFSTALLSPFGTHLMACYQCCVMDGPKGCQSYNRMFPDASTASLILMILP